MNDLETDSRENLAKVRRYKIFFLVAGVGLFALGTGLLIYFLVGKDIPALFLGCVAFVWGALLINQALKQRDIQDLIVARLARIEKAGPNGPGDSEDGEEEGAEPAPASHAADPGTETGETAGGTGAGGGAGGPGEAEQGEP